MRFWDTSAILPLIVQEEESQELRALLAADRQIIVWWGCSIEVVSALARLEREGALSEGHKAFKILDQLESSWNEVNPSDSLRQVARRILRVHALRAGDSLQLAAAIAASGAAPDTLPFVCRDARLTQAARKEGFTVY